METWSWWTLNDPVRFIGRVPSGFGIGALTEESPDKRQRWEQFYQQVLTGEERAVGEGWASRSQPGRMSPSILGAPGGASGSRCGVAGPRQW